MIFDSLATITYVATVLAVLIFMGLATVLGLALSRSAGLPDRAAGCGKLSPYECDSRRSKIHALRFDVRYYLVAIIFIVFDLEIAFFFPWAVSLSVTGTFGLIAMLISRWFWSSRWCTTTRRGA